MANAIPARLPGQDRKTFTKIWAHKLEEGEREGRREGASKRERERVSTIFEGVPFSVKHSDVTLKGELHRALFTLKIINNHKLPGLQLGFAGRLTFC